MVGRTISHYKIIERIGEGGMGVVYKAEDLKLERTVALKFLSAKLTQDENSKHRFINEAKAASNLQHINICTIHEIDESDDGQLFICMDYYQGETLSSKLEQGSLEEDIAINITTQIAAGLQAAHAKNIIHRDIKPANIIITEDGTVKILDFGLAKLTTKPKLTQSFTTLGTLSYMSPEQVQGQEVDHRSDIWSLGIVLYQMIYGNLPFEGEYPQSLMYAILYEDPPIPEVEDNPISQAVVNSIRTSLAKDPQQRFSNIEEMTTKLTHEFPLIDIRPPQKKWFSLRIPALYLILIPAMIAVLVLLFLLFPHAETITFSERDFVLITDFENNTEEDIFDYALNTALSISIEQSNYVNVFQKSRIKETLKRMKYENNDRIDYDIGLEVAQREGIDIVIVPEISRSGNMYAVSGRIIDIHTKNTIKSEMFMANGKNEVMVSVDKLGNRIRKDLGESLQSISRLSKPLAEVTTSSLEALKQYSLGVENHWNVNLKDARLYYTNALKIDSTFTAAKASLGGLEFERFDKQKGIKLIEEAVNEIDHLTEKEKYAILAFHEANVMGNIQKAIEFVKILSDLYPDDYSAYNNLGYYYNLQGNYRLAVSYLKKALNLNPYLIFSYSGLNWILLNRLGQLDSAWVWVQKQIKYDSTNFWGYNFLGWTYIGYDSLNKARQAIEEALRLNPNSILDLYRMSSIDRIEGNYREAMVPLKEILKIDANEASAYYIIGYLHELLNEQDLANDYYRKSKKIVEQKMKQESWNADHYIDLALILTRLGDTEKGYTLGRKAMQIDSSQHFKFAMLLSIQQNFEAAIEHLNKSKENGTINYIWMKTDVDFDAIRQHPEFQNLIAKGLHKNNTEIQP